MLDDEIMAPVRIFLARSFKGRAIKDEDDIFALGFGNSLFALQLVAFLESQFGVEVGSEDLEMDNFRSIRAISGWVKRKLSASQRAGAASFVKGQLRE